MNNDPAIRTATAVDVAKVKEIIDLSFPRFFRYFATQSVNSEEGKLFIIENQRTLLGFTKLIKFNIAGYKYGCILWIAIHPLYRQRGNAFALTNLGAEYLKKEGAKTVFASTQRRNIGALATLEKACFKRMSFLDLWKIFGLRVFKFYREIWYAPGEIVLMRGF